MIKKIIVSLVAIVVLILAYTPAASAAPAPVGPTITLDANDTGFDLVPTADDLSTRTGVNVVVVGSCDGGQYCIEYSKDQCDSGTAGGCAWATENCNVSITALTYDWDYWFQVFVTTHETVHCLTWIGGAGFFHVTDRDSILNPETARQTMRENQTRINSADRKMLQDIFS